MTPEQTLLKAGIRVHYSSIDVPHFRISGDVVKRSHRYSAFQQEVLKDGMKANCTLGLHLIAFDFFDATQLKTLPGLSTRYFESRYGPTLEVCAGAETKERLVLSTLTQQSFISNQITCTARPSSCELHLPKFRGSFDRLCTFLNIAS